jgi:hypothetical protein
MVDQKEVENVEYINCLYNLIANDATCSLHVTFNPGLPCQKQHSTRKTLTRKLNLNFRKKLLKCYVLRVNYCRAEILTLRKVDQKCLECFEIWYWRRMEINWPYLVKISVT